MKIVKTKLLEHAENEWLNEYAIIENSGILRLIKIVKIETTKKEKTVNKGSFFSPKKEKYIKQDIDKVWWIFVGDDNDIMYTKPSSSIYDWNKMIVNASALQGDFKKILL